MSLLGPRPLVPPAPNAQEWLRRAGVSASTASSSAAMSICACLIASRPPGLLAAGAHVLVSAGLIWPRSEAVCTTAFAFLAAVVDMAFHNGRFLLSAVAMLVAGLRLGDLGAPLRAGTSAIMASRLWHVTLLPD